MIKKIHKDTELLAIIPARSGSKRLPGKNTKLFCGKPLIAYTIQCALSCSDINRVLVDTDSEEIAKIARSYGADVPFLRPRALAQDHSPVALTVNNTLNVLAHTENYYPTHIALLQPTSPLRISEDITECWSLLKKSNATSVVTVITTQPKLFHIVSQQNLKLVGSDNNSQSFMLNGMVYVIEIDAFRREKKFITKKTKAIISPLWRSVDIDTLEDWVLAETLYKQKAIIKRRLKAII